MSNGAVIEYDIFRHNSFLSPHVATDHPDDD